ncbi:MAG: PEP-CTERM sorting domain-containing protein [Planctomycetes bacterium]|nr:PEP-CTERM sorting domain-containing protein [Planctomycetota bacterium]
MTGKLFAIRVSSLGLATAQILMALIVVIISTASADATTILFGGGQAGPTQGADAAVFAYLQDRYGAANVTYIQTSAAVAGDETGFDVFVISSTPGSGTIRNKWHDSATPILNWEEAVADNGAGEFMITAGRPKDNVATDHVITITDNHLITAGFAIGQDVTITTGQAEVWWSTEQQAPGSLSLAHEMGDPSRLFLTIVDEGGELNDGSLAPARRMMLGMTDSTFNAFTDDGRQLFGQAVDWTAFVIPEPSTFVLAALGLLGMAGGVWRRRRRD